MTAGVVDELEIVEVEEHHREPATGATGPAERVLEPVEEQRPVRQAGQRIMAGAIGERLGGELALGDVGDRDRHQTSLSR